MRRIHETIVALESNKYYIFMYLRPCVCVGGWVEVSVRALACACARVSLLIQYATLRSHIVCVLSGCTTFLTLSHKRHDSGKSL